MCISHRRHYCSIYLGGSLPSKIFHGLLIRSLLHHDVSQNNYHKAPVVRPDIRLWAIQFEPLIFFRLAIFINVVSLWSNFIPQNFLPLCGHALLGNPLAFPWLVPLSAVRPVLNRNLFYFLELIFHGFLDFSSSIAYSLHQNLDSCLFFHVKFGILWCCFWDTWSLLYRFSDITLKSRCLPL